MWSGATLVGGGAFAAIFGTIQFAQSTQACHGRSNDSCADGRSERDLGVGLLVGGAVAIGVGAVLAIVGATKVPVTSAPAPSGAGASRR